MLSLKNIRCHHCNNDTAFLQIIINYLISLFFIWMKSMTIDAGGITKDNSYILLSWHVFFGFFWKIQMLVFIQNSFRILYFERCFLIWIKLPVLYHMNSIFPNTNLVFVIYSMILFIFNVFLMKWIYVKDSLMT